MGTAESQGHWNQCINKYIFEMMGQLNWIKKLEKGDNDGDIYDNSKNSNKVIV